MDMFDGNKLRSLRQKFGLSQRDLADKSECSLNSVCQIELGRFQPKNDLAGRLAAALGVKIEDLQTADSGHQDDDATSSLMLWAQLTAGKRDIGFALAMQLLTPQQRKTINRQLRELLTENSASPVSDKPVPAVLERPFEDMAKQAVARASDQEAARQETQRQLRHRKAGA